MYAKFLRFYFEKYIIVDVSICAKTIVYKIRVLWKLYDWD